MGTIEKFVLRSLPWINKTQRLARKTYVPSVKNKFVDGEGFLYLGERYKLLISDTGDTPLSFTGKEFLLRRQYLPEARERFIFWYRNQALETLEQRVVLYGVPAGLKHSRIKISHARKRWGSCNSKGVLNFSWRLIMAPMKVVDYVVVHELAHILEHNHSKKFWDVVRIILPQYQQARAWLKQNQHQLVL